MTGRAGAHRNDALVPPSRGGKGTGHGEEMKVAADSSLGVEGARSMASRTSDLTCPACGERIYPSDQKCLACGARLDEGRLVGTEAPADDTAEHVVPPAARTAWPGGTDAAAGPSVDVPYATGAAPWRPEQVAGGGGLFDSISRGWVFLRESFAMAFRDKDLFLPSLFSVLANLVLLGGLGLILYLTGNLEALFADEGEGLTVTGWVVLLAATLTGYLVTYFFTGMTVHLVDVHLRGEDAQLGSAFADSLRNIGGITALAVVSVAMALIAGAIRGRSRGGLRRMAADTVERAWLAATYLMLPVMILEDAPFMQSADRATRLHRHNLLQIVIGELGLMITARIISGLTVFVAIGLAVGAYFGAPALLPVAIALALLLFVLPVSVGGGDGDGRRDRAGSRAAAPGAAGGLVGRRGE